MADLSAGVQKPTLTSLAPNYQTCAAADYFTAAPGSSYELHYKNGATPTTAVKITDQTSVAPTGASGAAVGWADVQVQAVIAANSERVTRIDNSNRFRDAQGRINLVHGTPTTLTVAIFGPYPAG